MTYNVEDIEDQIIATLQADSNLKGVTIRTHAGEVNAHDLVDPSMMEGLISLLPFIFVQYQGKSVKALDRDSPGKYYVHTLRFRLFSGAMSLRTGQEAQRGAYAFLRSIYDDIHGKVPYSSPQMLTGLGANNGYLIGTVITTTNFNPQSGFLQPGSEDERLIVNLPQIKVYHADYVIRLQT